ncbi:hypothetical protein MLD38_014479 [Melastoma candidum]|uniref:Uncharacterized protein n=1 Tax=Melastoma candidum TaxID=119954 RepID=A0ACB9RCT7_9MYRT|nr:hypothetical protein MLD38_014479 [Melastoma candidum]
MEHILQVPILHVVVDHNPLVAGQALHRERHEVGVLDSTQVFELSHSLLIRQCRAMNQHLHGNMDPTRQESPIHGPKLPSAKSVPLSKFDFADKRSANVIFNKGFSKITTGTELACLTPATHVVESA